MINLTYFHNKILKNGRFLNETFPYLTGPLTGGGGQSSPLTSGGPFLAFFGHFLSCFRTVYNPKNIYEKKHKSIKKWS